MTNKEQQSIESVLRDLLKIAPQAGKPVTDVEFAKYEIDCVSFVIINYEIVKACLTHCKEQIEGDGETDEAVKVCKQWFKYIDQQEQNTVTLQKAAALARKGQRDEALKMRDTVDNQPRVFDGAKLLPAVKSLISTRPALTKLKKALGGE